MAYIGKQPVVGNFQVCDAITVVNGQAAYTMQVGSANVNPENANHMLVSLNGVLQNPGSAFTISGATITFASNLATGDVIDFIILLGNVLDIGTPSDGTIATAKIVDDAVTAAKLAAGVIVQVVQTAKTDTTSESDPSTYEDITGMSVTITPTASSSKILVFADLALGLSNFESNHLSWRLLRGSTAIGVSTTASDADLTGTGGMHKGGSTVTTPYFFGHSKMFLDSPSTTSATTYKCQWSSNDSGPTLYLNRRGYGTTIGAISTITAMEVLG